MSGRQRREQELVTIQVSRACLQVHLSGKLKDSNYSYCKNPGCECWCHASQEGGRKEPRGKREPLNSSRHVSFVSGGLPTLGKKR
jgi:hypothetical protein